MTVADRVMMNTGPDETALLDTLGSRPLLGTVLAQDDPDDPTVATIQWDNGEQTGEDIPIGGLRQVTSSTTQEAKLTGKYLQLQGIRFESGSGIELSSGLSPAASGICIDSFRVSAFQDAASPIFCFATIAVDDGKSFMRVPFVDPDDLTSPATLEELQALGVLGVQESRRSVESL